MHFDTGHIIEMVRWRRRKSRLEGDRLAAYATISRAVTAGQLQVLFNPPSALEWVEGATAPRSWQELSEFFETAPLVKELEAMLAYLVELIEETRRNIPELTLPRIQIVRPVGEIPPEVIALAKHHPELGWMRELTPVNSPGSRLGVQQWVYGSAVFAKRREEAMKERTKGWRDAIRATRNEFRRNNAKHMRQSARIEWANRAQHLGQVLTSSNTVLDQKRLGALLDFSRLPACSLYLNALWRYAKSMTEKGPEDNDADDWLQVPAIAYADYSLVESKLRNHLLAGTPGATQRVFSDPVEFVRKLRF